MTFIMISLKKNIFPFCLCLFTIFLVVFSNSNINAAKNGLMLWANCIVPSLLPFFIATELLCNTNIIHNLGNIFNRFMRPLFNVPGAGAFALIMGIISGYPTGAKIVSNFRQQNICTKEEGERLLAFTNNSGPLFIIGTVGVSLFYNTTIGFLLLTTHLLACFSVGILFRFWKKNSFTSKYKSNNYVATTQVQNLGSILRR